MHFQIFRNIHPVKIVLSKNVCFCCCFFRVGTHFLSKNIQNVIVLCVEMPEIFEQKHKKTSFNTWPYGDLTLKIKISKIGIRHFISWPKLGLEPKFHETETFGGFGKRSQNVSDIQRIFNTGPYEGIINLAPGNLRGYLLCLHVSINRCLSPKLK